jgi:hypothetical protein
MPCNQGFLPSRADARTCSDACRQRAYRWRSKQGDRRCECVICGIWFRPSARSLNAMEYCSNSCFARAMDRPCVIGFEMRL